MRRPPALPMLLAATALAVVGCAAPAGTSGIPARFVVTQAGGLGELTVRPAIRPVAAAGERSLRSALISNGYNRHDIRHLVLALYTYDGGTETQVGQLDLLADYLDFGATFSRLKGNTTYRVRGFAYKAAGTAAQDLISYQDATTYAEIVLTDNETAPNANVPVKLIDVAPLVVTTLAGTTNGAAVDQPGSAARFNFPRGVAVDTSNRVYVADYNNARIRQISPTGAVATLAGNGGFGADNAPAGGDATFNFPIGLATDDTYVYVAEYGNDLIRRVAIADGATSTYAGDGVETFADGPAASASFFDPHGVAVAPDGTLYVADTGNHRIRKITTGGVVSTIAGTGGTAHVDGPGASAEFNSPRGIAIGPDGAIFVADTSHHAIRRLVPDGGGWRVTTLAGGSQGSQDGVGGQAGFNFPEALAVGANGYVYVADTNNHQIRMVAPNGGVRTILGGNPGADSDGLGPDAGFDFPTGLAVGLDGVIYVGDMLNGKVRRVL